MSGYSGSLLYPRLPRAAAEAVLAAQAGLDLSALRSAASTAHPDGAPAATGGHPVAEHRLADLASRVREVAVKAGFPQELGDAQRFDRPCGTILFENMDIVTADAAEEAVWSFLSLVLLPEIGPWRFPNRSTERMLGRPRNVLRRLWWRAWSLGVDLDNAPEGCQPLGEDEFVQIMERPSVGNNPRIARSIRDAVWRAEAEGLTMARSELMRGVTRRLRGLRSHIALDVLTDEQLATRLDRLAAETLEAGG
ncbi:MAG TPA: DUF6339 family protein [Iamia sp.]|nr:DUF6339 family protein [Iamia sp.]